MVCVHDPGIPSRPGHPARVSTGDEHVHRGGDLPRPWFSRLYARLAPSMDAEGMADLRTELLAPLTGTVVEVGCGPGMNFSHYPPRVGHVVAVEPEPRLRRIASQAADQAPVPVQVVPGRADALPVPSAGVDAVVFCLVMCSLDDPAAALRETQRVLRSDGTVHVLEHMVAEGARLRTIQRIVDATVWPHLAGGCHTARDPIAALRDAGFTITAERRLRFPEHRMTNPSTPHVLGRAQLATAEHGRR